MGQSHADLFDLDRLQPANEGGGAFQGLAFEQGVHDVGQGVVDGGFDVAVEAEVALHGGCVVAFVVTFNVVGAVLDVVAQHLVVPLGEGFFAAEVGHHLVLAGPLVFAFAADGAGADGADQAGAFGHAEGGGPPAANDGRIHEQHAAHGQPAQHGVACGAHQAQKAAQ